MSRRRTPHSSRSRRRSRSRSPPKSRSRHRRHRSPRSQSSSPCYDSSADELLPKRVAPAEPQPSFNALKTAQNFTADVEQMTVKDKMAHQAMITTNPAVTRLCRRVYIGNLPTEMGLTEPILLEFFAVLLRLKGISTPQALLSVWLSSPPAFGVSDFLFRKTKILKLKIEPKCKINVFKK